MKRTIMNFSAPTAERLGGTIRRAAMMLLLCMLTTMTAWAELRPTLTTETTELTTGTYNSSAITIEHRLTVNGNVTLNLVPNVAMTINGGIKLTPGSTLTIEGAISNFDSTPNLTIRECPDDEAGIRVHPGCTLIINGGFLDIEGGRGAAAIGGNNDAEAGTITINGGKIYANGGGNWVDRGDDETTDFSYSGSGIGCGGSHCVETKSGYGDYISGPAGGTITITGGEIYTNRIGDQVIKRADLAAKITITGGKIYYLPSALQSWTSFVGNEVTLDYNNADNFCLDRIDFSGIKTLKLQKNFKIDGTNTVMEAGNITDVNFLKANSLWGRKILPCTETIYSVNKGDATNGSFALKVGGFDIKKAIAGSTVQVVASPDNGYELTGVTATGATVSNSTFTMPAQDVTVTPTFTAKASHSISYVLNGGTQNMSNPTSYQTATGVEQFYNPTRTYYSFEGWYDNAGFTGSPVTSIPAGTVGDKKLYAKWAQYTITYNLNDGENDNRNPTYYDSAVGVATLYPATRTGYDFNGWYYNEFVPMESITAGTTGNITLNAHWTDHYCTITFDANGGGGLLIEPVQYNNSYTLPENPFTAPTGMEFDGWMIGENKYNEGYTLEHVTDDVTVKAVWKWLTFGVVFDLNEKEGTPPEMQEVQYGTKATEPEAPRATGYVFAGWYKERDCTNRWEFTSETVKTNTPLYAKWVEEAYTITYVMDGGENSAYNPVTYTVTDNITLVAPTKTGHTFMGWYEGNQQVTGISTGSTGNITFTAHWQINQYTLTFKDGNTIKATITQDYGTDVTEPDTLAKKEYLWDCWSPSVPATMPAENMTFTAQWIELHKVDARPATCTTEGYIEYYRYEDPNSNSTRYFREVKNGDEYTYTEISLYDTKVEAKGHTWETTPEWAWEKTWYAELLATVHVDCTECDYIAAANTTEFTTEVTKAPTETEDGLMKYTATIWIDNSKYYSDTHTEVIPRTGVVAVIGDTEYSYLKTALDAAVDGDVVTVLADIDDPYTSCGSLPSYTHGIVLDLNGRTVTLKSIEMSSDLTVKNGTLTCQIVNNNGGSAHTLTLDNATLNCPQPADEWSTSISWMAKSINVTHGSTLTITGKTFFGYGEGSIFQLSIDNTSKVVLNNAVISNGYGQDAAVRGQFAQYLPEGYTLNSDPNDDIPDGTVMYNSSVYTSPVELVGSLGSSIVFADNANNDDAVSDAKNANKALDVTIYKRRLYKDGEWNTICLPFDYTPTGKFADAILMELDTETIPDGGHKTGFSNGTLYLNFKSAQSIVAGKPYIIRWEWTSSYDTSQDIVNPSFSGVTVTSTTPTSVSSDDGKLAFCGTYNTTTFYQEDKSILLLGAENALYWPKSDASIGAFRAYFQLTGIEAGSQNTNVRAFVLNFGDEASGITTTECIDNTNSSNAWYTLDGRKLSGNPSQRGVYVNGGRKVVIK